MKKSILIIISATLLLTGCGSRSRFSKSRMSFEIGGIIKDMIRETDWSAVAARYKKNLSLTGKRIAEESGGKPIYATVVQDDGGGQKVIDRVVNTFNAHYNMDEECDIRYEMREISRAGSYTAQ